MYGGFVEWEKGEMDDGSDSIAKQVISLFEKNIMHLPKACLVFSCSHIAVVFLWQYNGFVSFLLFCCQIASQEHWIGLRVLILVVRLRIPWDLCPHCTEVTMLCFFDTIYLSRTRFNFYYALEGLNYDANVLLV